MTGFVPSFKINSIKAEIEKINRKAKKHNLDGFTLVIGEEKVNEYKDADFEVVTKITIEGSYPTFGGWELVSVIEFKEDIGSISRTVPHKTLPEKYFEHDDVCEHCNTKHVRKYNYIVENTETGVIKSVGSSCLKLFLGGKTAGDFLYYANLIGLEEKFFDEDYNCGSAPTYYPLENVICYGLHSIENWGWVSKAASEDSGERSTATDVLNILCDQTGKYNVKEMIAEYTEKAIEILEFTKTIEVGDNDYLNNLKKYAIAGYCDFKGVGLVVSMIPNHYRMTTEKIKKPDSNFIGVVGEKLTSDVTFKKEIIFNSRFGSTYFLIFEDNSGNVIVWNSSNPIDVEEDEKYTITGRIKEHKEYCGVKQNVLTRCKIKGV